MSFTEVYAVASAYVSALALLSFIDSRFQSSYTRRKMVAPTTLCIIDMQPFFISSQEDFVIEGVLDQIRLAKQRNAGVVVVRYTHSGKTDDRITDALTGYDRVVKVNKSTNDGSKVIIKAIKRKHGFSKKRIRICGVNTGFCVYETAAGLAKKLPGVSIEMVENACNDTVDAHILPSKTLRIHKGAPKNIRVV